MPSSEMSTRDATAGRSAVVDFACARAEPVDRARARPVEIEE